MLGAGLVCLRAGGSTDRLLSHAASPGPPQAAICKITLTKPQPSQNHKNLET